MALYGLDHHDCVFAADACPKKLYRCLECQALIKVRKGRQRLPHFYHLQQAQRCRLYSKSKDHLFVQLQIKKVLANETIQLEHPFPSIHRIADVLWEKERLIFEIQCSPISVEETKQRTEDYKSLGYEVVWLLDDRVFNKRFVRPVELFLRKRHCYFFSFSKTGLSSFYDQLEIIVSKYRHKKGTPLSINLLLPRPIPLIKQPNSFPQFIKTRIEELKIFFHGDVLYRALTTATNLSSASNLERWSHLELALCKKNRPPGILKLVIWRCFIKPYRQMLEYLLNQIAQKP